MNKVFRTKQEIVDTASLVIGSIAVGTILSLSLSPSTASAPVDSLSDPTPSATVVADDASLSFDTVDVSTSAPDILPPAADPFPALDIDQETFDAVTSPPECPEATAEDGSCVPFSFYEQSPIVPTDTHVFIYPHELPPCPDEDGLMPETACYWDATTRGNGIGHSFISLPK